MVEYHREHDGLATIFTHPNSHPYDSGFLNTGLHILSPQLLKMRPDAPKVDLDRQILRPLAGTRELVVYTARNMLKIWAHRKRQKAILGGYIDGIYYGPHHPDKGFEGEVPELKFDCIRRRLFKVIR